MDEIQEVAERWITEAAVPYMPLYTYSFDPDGPRSPQQPLGTRDPRRCRFCNNAEEPLTFKDEAHVIPAAFGNRDLLSWEECDRCNDRGSRFEDALSKRLSMTRAMSRIAGREGDPKHRFGRYPSFVQSQRADNTVVVSRVQGDATLKVRRTPTGVRYVVRVPRYRPLGVAKSLARMAYFVLPDTELARFDHVRRWLRGEHEWLPTIFRGFVPGTGLRRVTLNVEVRANSDDRNTPLARVFFAFSTSLHVLHIPDASWVMSADLTLPDVGLSPYPPHETSWRSDQLLSDGELPPYEESFDVAVPALANVPPSSHAEIQRAAYARWEARGHADGSDVDDWVGAEEDLLIEQLNRHSDVARE